MPDDRPTRDPQTATEDKPLKQGQVRVPTSNVPTVGFLLAGVAFLVPAIAYLAGLRIPQPYETLVLAVGAISFIVALASDLPSRW